jgi:hypothetical protein
MEDYWTHARGVQHFEGFDLRREGHPARADATKENGDTAKFSTKLFRLRAVELIEEHAANHTGSPFFLYMPFQAVSVGLVLASCWSSTSTPPNFTLPRLSWPHHATSRAGACATASAQILVGPFQPV